MSDRTNYLDVDASLDDDVLGVSSSRDSDEIEIPVFLDEEDDLDYVAKPKGDDTTGVDDKEPDTEPERQQKGKGNVHAALRVAERNNRILSERLDRIVSILESKAKESEPEEELEDEDYSGDPVGAVNAKVDKLLKKSAEKEALEEANRQEREAAEHLRRANNDIQEYAKSLPEGDYRGAVEHIIAIRKEDMINALPDATDSEIEQFLAREIAVEKIRLASQGKNPGEFLYKWAKRHGYRPAGVKAQNVKAPARQAVDGREAVRRSRERDEKAATISTTPGKSASQSFSGDFVGMSEDDFEAYLTQLEKSKGRRGLSVGEILGANG